MKRIVSRMAFLFLFLAVPAWGATLAPETKTATVLIANYDDEGDFLGWGSGFFVDEGIVVTNKHVIEGGDWYRVYPIGDDEAIDVGCAKSITKSDVKINLNDDVAYVRVFLSCDHDVMRFADNDPENGDPVWVIGFPYRGSVAESMTVVTSSGTVTGTNEDGWLRTDAQLDLGSSGGPVVNGAEVVGVAVAKGVDREGKYLTGYFIPVSVIVDGLLYANDARFGYTPQSRASSSRRSSSPSSRSSFSSADSSVSARSSSRRSSAASSKRSRASQRSSARSVAIEPFPDVSSSREGYAAILSLRDRSVIGGHPDGTFRPDDGINRAEFIKLLVAGFLSEELRGETGCFSDVANEWFAPYVCAALRLGWIGGYPDGTFRPAQQINRAEAMKIVIEAFGAIPEHDDDVPSDVRIGTWFRPYVAAGVKIGIVDDRVLFHPDHFLTREHAAMWIDGAEE